MEQKNLLRQEDIINLPPQDRIQGFDVRPGFYEINGASAFPNGVNFTIISFGAVSCTLLLFHRRERTPYARLPFPAHYRVGNVFLHAVERCVAWKLMNLNTPTPSTAPLSRRRA